MFLLLEKSASLRTSNIHIRSEVLNKIFLLLELNQLRDLIDELKVKCKWFSQIKFLLNLRT